MSNNPDTWCSYDIAKERSSNFDGMGIMFSGGICGIDIDGADGHTKMNPLQAEVMELFKGTYTEFSPSGKGIHILFRCDRAKLPLQIDENGNFKRNDKGYLMLDGYKQKNDASGLECYFDGVTARYFTFTGNKISDTSTIADKTEEVLIFLDRYMKDTKKAKNGGHKSSTEECETCKKRKYQDGSDEANVSFKSASHISPESAASAVRAHEGEHVSNAYKKAAEKDGKVVRASVSIHTSVCPECGRVYVSGGTTDTTIKYGDETNPYQKDKKSLGSVTLRGDNLDYTL